LSPARLAGLAALCFLLLCESAHVAQWWGNAGPVGAGGFDLPRALLNGARAGGCFLAAAAYLALLWMAGTGPRRWLGAGRRAGAVLDLAAGIVAAALVHGAIGALGLVYPLTFSIACLAAAGSAGACGAHRALWRSRPVFAWRDLWPGLFLLPALPWLLAAPLIPAAYVNVPLYHLGLPVLWRITHRICPDPGCLVAFFPLGVEQAFLPLVVFGVPGATVASCVLLLGVTGWLLARLLTGSVPSTARLAGWLLVGCSGALHLVVDGHPDVVLLFAGVALFAALLDRDGAGWGIAAGLAMLCKVTGVILAGSFVVAALFCERPSWRAFRLGSAVALAVVGGWLVRNWLATGNPVYPVGYPALPSLGWADWSEGRLLSVQRIVRPVATWSDWLPLHEAASREWACLSRDGVPPLLGLVCLLPVVLLSGWTGRPIRALGIQAAVYAALMAHPTMTHPRYALPVLVGLVPVLLALAARVPSGLVSGCVCAAMLAEAASFSTVYHAIHVNPERVLAGAPPAGTGTGSAGEPAAVEWVNANSRASDRVAICGTGYGLSRAWRQQDYPDQLLFERMVGATTDSGRMRIRLRESGVRWIMLDPADEFYATPILLRPDQGLAWYRSWFMAWRRCLVQAYPAGRPASTGEWYVFEVRAATAPGTRKPAGPWSVADRRRWEERLFGAFGVYWWRQAKIASSMEDDEERTRMAAERAIRLGRREPWLFNRLTAACLRLGRPADAEFWARLCLRVWPGNEDARRYLATAVASRAVQ